MPAPLIVPATAAAELLSCSERKFHYLRAAEGFPAPISLGPHCLRWRVTDLQDWIAAQPTAEPQPEPERIRLARDALGSER